MDKKKEKRQNGPKCLTLEETVCETTAIFGRHPVPLHVTSRLCYSMMRARAGILNRMRPAPRVPAAFNQRNIYTKTVITSKLRESGHEIFYKGYTQRNPRNTSS